MKVGHSSERRCCFWWVVSGTGSGAEEVQTQRLSVLCIRSLGSSPSHALGQPCPRLSLEACPGRLSAWLWGCPGHHAEPFSPAAPAPSTSERPLGRCHGQIWRDVCSHVNDIQPALPIHGSATGDLSNRSKVLLRWGFPGGTVVKNPLANAGDTGSSPGPGRS